MKKILLCALLLLCLVALLQSCATRYCQPSRGSRDWAIKYVHKNPDGSGWAKLVRFSLGTRHTKTVVFGCLPDSVKIGNCIEI